jgi:hypothetical protein
MPFPNFAGGESFAVYARYCITSSLGVNEALSFVFLYMLGAFQDSHLFAIFARLRKAKRRKDDELVMINQWKKEEPLWNKEKMPIYFWPFHYYTWKTPLFRVSTYDVFSFNAHFDLLYFRTYVKIQAFHWFRHSTLTHGKR